MPGARSSIRDRVAGGSDFPVESDNPFFGLHAAVTRTDRANQPPAGGIRNKP